MAAVVYLILSLAVGYCIVKTALPGLSEILKKTYSGKNTGLSVLFAYFPACFTTGILAMTWPVYILACIFRKSEDPLLIANIIVFSAAVIFVILMLFYLKKKNNIGIEGKFKLSRVEISALVLVCVLICILMFKTLCSKNGKLYVGLSVFSDFSTHLSMIRSFSKEANFPTMYTFFGGQDVKYHFMFQFLCGNLEYLGLRLDLALNIPSILSLISTYMMLYVLAVKITGKKAVGLLTWLLFSFRSSWAFFEYLKNIRKGEIVDTLSANAGFIGATEHEDWGLWNLNVYCNQRHLAFSLTVMLLVIMLMLPCLYEMYDRLRDRMSIGTFFKESLFAREGWVVRDLRTCIFAGLVLGAIGFFNGAVLIGTVIVLFFMAAGSDRRIEFVILAGIAGILSMVQSNIFIDGSLFEPAYRYGFLSDRGTVFSSIDFVWKMMGLLPLVLLVYFAFAKGIRKYVIVCFSMPIVFSFTVSLTPDISVNHKYIMIAIMLLDIFAADFVLQLFEIKQLTVKILAVMTAFCLVFTGIYEYFIVMRMNNDESAMKYDFSDELMEWVWDNADHDDIFLTKNYYLSYGGHGNSIILSGAMMYYGWDYFSWSAGYDTDSRVQLVHEIYSCTDPDSLYRLVDDTGIRYIVVDESNRQSEDYLLCEWIFDLCYKKVYCKGEGMDMISIYDTNVKMLER